MELVGTVAVIHRSLFVSNINGSLKGIAGKLWEERETLLKLQAGGALIVTHSDITITRSTFKGNSAGVGGAIFGDVDSNITIFASMFDGNRAANLNNNTDCFGGALYVQSGCRLIIQGCIFNSNTAICKREGNSTEVCVGGAIAAVGGAEVCIVWSSLSQNHAVDGGAIIVRDVVMNLDRNVFSNNKASLSGGAIYVSGRSSTNIFRSNFSCNQAHVYGAIWTDGHLLCY